jgi:hypothetical protein
VSAPRGPKAIPVAVILLGGLGAWFAARGRPPEPPPLDDEAPEPVSARRARPAPVANERPPAREVADDGVPIMPASTGAPLPEGPVHPHPITPRHQRIFRENRLIGSLDGAMDVGDVSAMRRFLDEYRRDYPEDDHQLQSGYAIIADCLERPGETPRAAALLWADAHRGSTLRRFVTRHCLE